MNRYDSVKQFNIDIPANAQYILEVLNEAGYEAFIVGGCVRDVILGRKPEDWDITTSAKPEEVKALFKRTIDTGLQHGTVTVMMDKEGYEVTTYRIDGEYLDGRHPESVEFTSNLIEDLKRRDFTINAMAYNPAEGIVDAFGGIDDMKNGIIKCVGNAVERFTEDALRILRAIRFSAQLGFDIEDNTREAISKLAPNITKISKERIRVELDKLLLSERPEYIKECYTLGVSKYVIPWLDKMFETEQNTPYHIYNVGDHTMEALKNIASDRYLRWAMLLHDIGKPQTRTTDEKGVDHFYDHAAVGGKMANEVLRDLRFDNNTISIVSRLVTHHGYHPRRTRPSVRRSIYRIGEDIYPLFLEIKKADTSAKGEQGKAKGEDELSYLKKEYAEIMDENCCLSLKQLAVNGSDLIEAGVPKGEKIGETLQRFLYLVLDEPSHNTKEYLLSLLKNENE